MQENWVYLLDAQYADYLCFANQFINKGLSVGLNASAP